MVELLQEISKTIFSILRISFASRSTFIEHNVQQVAAYNLKHTILSKYFDQLDYFVYAFWKVEDILSKIEAQHRIERPWLLSLLLNSKLAMLDILVMNNFHHHLNLLDLFQLFYLKLKLKSKVLPQKVHFKKRMSFISLHISFDYYHLLLLGWFFFP